MKISFINFVSVQFCCRGWLEFGKYLLNKVYLVITNKSIIAVDGI